MSLWHSGTSFSIIFGLNFSHSLSTVFTLIYDNPPFTIFNFQGNIHSEPWQKHNKEHILMISTLNFKVWYSTTFQGTEIYNRNRSQQSSLHIRLSLTQAVPWFKQLIGGLSPWRPWFHPRCAYLCFVKEKVAMREVFLWALQSSPVSTIPQMLLTHSFIYHRYYKISANESVIKWHII